MEMHLDFSLRTVGEWRDFLNKAERTSWTQTFSYATAVAKVAHESTRFATLQKDSETIGVVAIQELKLGPLHFVTITRGPLWFKGHENSENMKEFMHLMQKTFPKRPLRRIRWMPEWALEKELGFDFIEQAGFKKTKTTFETLWLDLTPSLEELKKKLNRKWRNHLSKAERSPLEISIDNKGAHLDQFLRSYDIFKAQKKFEGPNGSFFKHEIETARPFKDALILWARLNDIPVAGVVVIKHGNSASYRVSWNTAEGRLHNAHFLLLWKAIEILKKMNIQHFDLGGILPDDNDGLNIFKLGMNGTRFKTEVFK